MSGTVQSAVSILGRLMIVTIYMLSGLGNKIPNFKGVVQAMEGEGVPAASVLLVGAIAFLVVGSLSVLVGWKARIGAGLLFVFLVLATYYFHDFWNFQGAEQQAQMIQFMKNLSLMGAMVFLIANGPGAGSIDNASSRLENRSVDN